jgi:hypothetical protein
MSIVSKKQRKTTAKNHHNRLIWIFLGVILFAATILRFYDCNNPILWYDEISNLGLVTGQDIGNGDEKFFPRDTVVLHPNNTSSINSAKPLFEAIFSRAPYDVNPPLPTFVLYLWRCVFGDSVSSVRMLSILPSIACVLLIFLVCKELFDEFSALWAALLMCLATPQIVYAYEVRAYALLFFWGLATALVIIQLEKKGPTWWRILLLALLSFCLSMTHYFSFGFLVSLAIYCVIRLRGKSLFSALIGFGIGGVLFLISWGETFYHQFFGNAPVLSQYLASRKNPNISAQAIEFLAGWLERVLLHLPVEYLARPSWVLIVFLLPSIAIFWKRNLLLPWLWLSCTVGFVWGLDVWRDTYHFTEIRYTLLAAPAAYLIIATGIFLGKRQVLWNSIAPALLSIYLVFQIPKAYTPYKENWSEVANLIKNSGASNEAIILPHVGQEIQIYLPSFLWTAMSYYAYCPDRPMVILRNPMSQEMIAQLGWGSKAWILTKFPDFPQSASQDWASLCIPGCRVIGSWVAQNRATIFHVVLPDSPKALPPTLNIAP